MRISDWSSDVCSSDLLDGAGRLRPDGSEGRPPSPPHRAAPTMKKLHRGPGARKDGFLCLAGLIKSPGGSEIAPVLVVVGITDHHFLITATRHQRADLRLAEIGRPETSAERRAGTEWARKV